MHTDKLLFSITLSSRRIKDEEFHSFEEKGQAIVEKTLYLSNTVALVTALLLSMLLPLVVPAATGDAAAASDDSLDFFGKKGCRILLILYYLSLSLVTTTSLSGLMAAIMVITTLGNWLTEVKEKLEWIMEYVKCLMVQSLTMQLSFFFLALTVLFGALLTSPAGMHVKRGILGNRAVWLHFSLSQCRSISHEDPQAGQGKPLCAYSA